MTFRFERAASDRRKNGLRLRAKTRANLRLESLEGRELLSTASLASIAPITSPAGLGYQVPLDGSASGASTQNYTATSSNKDIKVSVSTGKFVTFNVTHTSSGGNDKSFSGAITFQLFDELTPISAARIENLVTTGFYNGKNFHRISAGFPDSNGFIAQGGSVSGTGLDSPPAAGQPGGLPTTGYPFVDEYDLTLVNNGFGQLALANAGNDTNTSQFYITSSTPRFLDFNKTIFGQLVAGTDIYKDIIGVATQSGSTTPASPITITTATLSNTNPNGVVHVDTTGATQGETGTVTVTATDPSSNTTSTQTFNVTVGATNATAPSDPNSNERPFIKQNYPTSLTTGQGQPIKFLIPAVTAQPKTDTLSYIVQDSVNSAGTGFNAVKNATATVDSNGVVTVTPNAGFSGTINLLIGVRNQVDHSGAGVTSPGNYDTHNVTLTVNADSTAVGQVPITVPVTAGATANTPVTVQLNGVSGNPGSSQGLTYAIVTQPTNGTLSNLNATTGTVTYTANPGFKGTDTFTYNATSTGSPTPNFVSNTSTVTLNVSLGQTGAVRQIDNVLVITPPPRFDGKGNVISVDLVNGAIQTTVNGVIDSQQPTPAQIDSIVIYGTPLKDSITVSPSIDIPTTIDGGHGGVNFLTAGGGDAQIHAWFGKNVTQGGVGFNSTVGRLGHVKVKKSSGTDQVFLSTINPAKHVPFGKVKHGKPASPGSFYKFVGKHLVKTKQPVTTRVRQG